jgi:hypothetical protein
MGPQSQQCTGSVKKSKEAAISHKKKHGGRKSQLTIPFLLKKKDAISSNNSTKTKTIKSNNIVTPAATVKKRKYTSGCYQCWRLTYNHVTAIEWGKRPGMGPVPHCKDCKQKKKKNKNR